LVEIEEIEPLETQGPARAASDAFSAGQAVTVLHRLAQPRVAPNVNRERAVEITYPALDAASLVWHDLPFDERLALDLFFSDQILKGHIVSLWRDQSSWPSGWQLMHWPAIFIIPSSACSSTISSISWQVSQVQLGVLDGWHS
jgi:hypothetical protein